MSSASAETALDKTQDAECHLELPPIFFVSTYQWKGAPEPSGGPLCHCSVASDAPQNPKWVFVREVSSLTSFWLFTSSKVLAIVALRKQLATTSSFKVEAYRRNTLQISLLLTARALAARSFRPFAPYHYIMGLVMEETSSHNV